MYLLNNNRQWAEEENAELIVSAKISIFSHVNKIKHCTIQDYYVIKSGNRLFSLAEYASKSTQA